MGKSNFAVFILCLVIFIVFAAGGSFALYKNVSKTEGFVKTEAVVVDYKEKTDYDVDRGYETMYCEIVEYTVDGQTYRASNSVWTNVPEDIGKKIDIAYDPDMPSNCVFVKSSYIFPMICFAIAAVTFAVLIAHVVTCIKLKNRH
ncbi:MAG: hypothetical protein K2O35_01395 [Clostridia bacterium]|nr:hypothetical protein [Clostridia bacterium]